MAAQAIADRGVSERLGTTLRLTHAGWRPDRGIVCFPGDRCLARSATWRHSDATGRACSQVDGLPGGLGRRCWPGLASRLVSDPAGLGGRSPSILATVDSVEHYRCGANYRCSYGDGGTSYATPRSACWSKRHVHTPSLIRVVIGLRGGEDGWIRIGTETLQPSASRRCSPRGLRSRPLQLSRAPPLSSAIHTSTVTGPLLRPDDTSIARTYAGRPLGPATRTGHPEAG